MKGNESQQARSVTKNGLTPKQERAILALLSEPTMKEAAKIAGIGETTLWRWLQDKNFHAAYMLARRESVKQALANLQQSSSEAVKVLCEVMNDKQINPFARVGAAKAIIEYSIKAVEVEDLAHRVDELEHLMGQQAEAQAQAGNR